MIVRGCALRPLPPTLREGVKNLLVADMSVAEGGGVKSLSATFEKNSFFFLLKKRTRCRMF